MDSKGKGGVMHVQGGHISRLYSIPKNSSRLLVGGSESWLDGIGSWGQRRNETLFYKIAQQHP